jgi:hypothetical protein
MPAQAEQIAWESLERGKEQARTGKPVLIDFSAAPV